MAFDPISAGFDFAGKLLDKFFPDPAQKAQAMLQLTQMKQSGELAQLTADTDLAKGQLAINQQEAGNGSLFVAGWRPCIGWVCGAAFAYKFVLQPFLIFLLVACGSKFDYKLLPALDWSEISPVLFGLLGLGTMRTIEKVKGVTK